jgi:hypothetical protein
LTSPSFYEKYGAFLDRYGTPDKAPPEAELLGGPEQSHFSIEKYDAMRKRGYGREDVRPASEPSEKVGPVEGFTRTFIHEMGPGLLGFEEPEAVAEFKRKHPIGAFGAFLLGAAGPYGLGAKFGLKAAAKLPGLRRGVAFVSDVERMRDAPGLTKAAKEVVRWAPFELGRVTGAAAFGPEGAFSEVRNEALLELGFFGTLGGVAGKIGGAKIRPKTQREGLISERFADYQVNEAPQVRLESLRNILTNNSKDDLGEGLLQEIYDVRAALRKEISFQRPYKKAYVQKLIGGKSASALNNIFKGGRSGFSTRHVSANQEKHGGLGSQEELDRVVSAIMGKGESGKFWESVQYPRVLTADGPKASKSFREFLKGHMKKVDSGMGDNAFIAKEAEGNWVMVKRIRGRTLEGKQGDQFAIWKTNSPGVFHPEAERFGSKLVRGAFLHDPDAELMQKAAALPSAKFIVELKKLLKDSRLSGVEANKISSLLEDVLTPEIEALRKEGVGGLKFIKQQVNRVVSPSIHEFSQSANAVVMMSIVRAAYARAQSQATALFAGKRGPSQAKNIFGEIFGAGAGPRTGGIEPLIDKLSKEEVGRLHEAFIRKMSVTEAQAEGFGRNVVKLMRTLEKADKAHADELARVEELIETRFVAPLTEHFVEARAWRGTYRVPLKEILPDGTLSKDGIVGVASGKRRKEAIEEAQEVIKRAKEKGLKLGFKEGEARVLGRDEDLALAKELLTQSNAAKIIRGAKVDILRGGDINLVAPTHKELKRLIYGNIIESRRTITDKLLTHILAPDIHKLHESYPLLAKQFTQRLESFAGRRGRFIRGIDEAADAILAPFLGKNSASEIVRMANRLMFSWTLGMGDLGFVTMNALTPIQTVLPEIAWTLSAAPKRLAKYYSEALVLGRDGPHSVSFLEPLKIMRGGLRALSKPNAEQREAFRWATLNGHVDPKFVEEFFGQNAEIVKNWGKMLKGEQGFLEWAKAFSEYMPGKSEELSRAFSFMVGHQIGKDFFRLEGKRLLQFSAEFTGRTNYLYSTYDRPRIITGAVGSLFGLFKNWAMNYTANMMSYAGEGFLRGNFKPLLWASAGTITVGGLGALPLYGVADGLSKLLSDDSIVQNLYGAFGDPEDTDHPLLDTAMYGLPAFLGTVGLGASLQGRAAPTGNHLMRDLNFLTHSAVLDRGMALGDAVGDYFEHAKTLGRHPIHSQTVRDKFYYSLLPRTWFRAVSFTEDGALKSLRTGNRLYSPVSMPQRIQFAFGFAPVDFEKAFEIPGELFADQRRMREKTSVFGRAYAEAQMKNDSKTMMDILKRAVLEPDVQISSLLNSAKAQYRTFGEDVADRQFDQYTVYQMEKRLGLR